MGKLLGACCAFAICWCVRGEQVLSLPRYGAPPTAHHSGFVEVDASTGTNLFYYLVESQSSPGTDPLLWWMSGGPGATSLIGLLAETGPLLLNEAGNLINNPYAWNQKANVLYVEFGPGVGFSYCANSSSTDPNFWCPQSRGDCSPCDASDNSVAKQNVALIEHLLTVVFPDMAGRPLYIAGESYAGVYIPTLAAALIDHFRDTSVVNLNGLWVTDPCTDNIAQFGWLDIGVDFSFRKGLISKNTFDALSSDKQGCVSGRTPTGDRIRNTDSTTCKRAWRLYDLATAGLGNAKNPASTPGLPMYIDPLNALGPGGGADLGAYLSSPDVRKAMHASSSPNKVYHVEIGNNGYSNYYMQYKACNPDATDSEVSMISVYKSLIASVAKSVKSASNLKRIIISSGDIDPVVAMQGTEAAVHAMGLAEAAGGSRRPWFFNATATSIEVLANKPLQWGQSLHWQNAGVQVGGFLTSFETNVPSLTFEFVTVRASGHMVPQYAPDRAFHVISRGLLLNKVISPLLPAGWDTTDDEGWYGRKRPTTGGTFSAWVNEAMSSTFVGADTPQIVGDQMRTMV